MSPTIPLPPHDVPLAGQSPFPRIENYAFLSDCHTCCLIAPDGAVEWMGVPRFDSPSMFGALLDRRAGSFRVGPYGLNVPLSVRYLPGTMVLETTWLTPSGWLVVRDALTIGPWHGEQAAERSPHTRPPTDNDADHMLVRMIECVQGSVQVEVVCEPIFDYGRVPAAWELCSSDWGSVEAEGAGEKVRLASDLRIGIEGSRARARHTLVEGERRFVALGWTHGLEGPKDIENAEERLEATQHFWRDWLAGGRFPRPSLAWAPASLGADTEGPDLHADRCHGRGGHHVAAGGARRRAQLGLPLLLDARRHVHALGTARARLRLGG